MTTDASIRAERLPNSHTAVLSDLRDTLGQPGDGDLGAAAGRLGLSVETIAEVLEDLSLRRRE